MKTILFLLVAIISTPAFSDNHEYWRYQSDYYEWGRLPESLQEQRHVEEMRMLQGLQRELRDTGEIAPKDAIDIYNLRRGYGYDGGPSNYYRPYGGY